MTAATAHAQDAPSALGPLLELRAVFEVLSYFSLNPSLRKIVSPGDGHPVLTLPPFMSDDKFMSPMRKFLASLGYAARGWDLEQNSGFDEAKFEKLARRIDDGFSTSGEKVSLIGHSLGGIYARLLAHEVPHAVRQVIYLGTPFNISVDHGADLPIRRIYERLNPVENASELMQDMVDMGSTPTPSTAIYSEGDGFVPWRFCIDEVDDITENIRIAGSHTGMPFNLPALYAIADRLAQPEGDWKPFDVSGLRRYLFSSTSPGHD